MSLCINPRCSRPDHPRNDHARYCARCKSDLLIGGRYRVLRLLSDKTGFGKIYEAYEHTTPKILKVLKENWNTSSKVVELFEQEARVLGELEHPGIPKVDGYFQHPVSQQAWPSAPLVHCIAMEKVDGLNLEEWMVQQGNHPISQKQAIQWLKQVVEVLDVVHAHQYFHRDIKPANIMLHRSGQLMLIDFGTARDLTYSYASKLQGNQVTAVVSPGFTPPEQINGQAVLQSDFFALGRSFVQLLAGKHPLELYDAQNDELHWRNYTTNICPSLLDLIDRLMARLPGDRPANTKEILHQITTLEASLQPELFPPPSPPYLPSPPSSSTTSPSPPSSSPSSGTSNSSVVQASTLLSHRSNLYTVAAIVGLVAAAGAIGYWLNGLRSGDAPTRSPIADSPIPPLPTSNFPSSSLPSSSDYANLRLVNTLSGHAGAVNTVAISPDGKTIASGSTDNTVKLWNLETGEVQTFSGHLGAVRSVVISPDGRTIASGSTDNTIKIWNLETGDVQTLLGHSAPLRSVAISPDGQTIVSGSEDNTIKVWNWVTGEARTLLGHSAPVRSVAISPDGQTIVSGSEDNTIKIWNLATGEVLQTHPGLSQYVFSVVISPDGQTIVSGSGSALSRSDSVIEVWNLATGDVKTLAGNSRWINSIAISPDGQTIVSGSGNLIGFSGDYAVKIWNLKTSSLVRELEGHSGSVRSVAMSLDGKTIVSGSFDRTIKVWRLE